MSQEQDEERPTTASRDEERTIYLDRTRSFCQFRVGKSQVIDVVLHRRPEDRSIARSDVVDLLETSILPRLFADSIEEQHARDTNQPIPPSELGLGGIPITQQQQQHKKKKAATQQRKKKMTKKERAAWLQQQKETERQERKNQKEVYYATSDTLRIAYQLHSSSAGGGEQQPKRTSSSGSATLVREQHGWTALTPVDDHRRGRRLELWCYPFDVELPAEHGFLRPTMIPMTSLFRLPKEGEDHPPPTIEKNPSPKKKKRRKQK